MMSMWQIEGFAPAPANYATDLSEVLKSFPSPDLSKHSWR
jgi:hypothetical protein